MQMIQGNIVDVITKSIFPGEIVIKNGRIFKIKKLDIAPEVFIIPGFVDAHVHIESSMLIPSEFARLAVRQGTVATVSDPHEIANVLGKEGVKFMINNGNKTPFKFYFGAPSCVPATRYETAGAEINVDDIREILSWDKVNYLAEMMNFPGVLNDDVEVLAKIEAAKQLGKKIDGHAPGLRGENARKYIHAGISTDHECFTKEEALEKLSYGMKIIIREGSAAKNFEALWELIDDYPEQVMLCSDDKHPNDLMVGHVNKLASRAIGKGCDTFNVLRACSLNPIRHYDMEVGLLQEGDPADFCIVSDLINFNVLQTWINGDKMYDEGRVLIEPQAVKTINNFNCKEISPVNIQLKDKGKKVNVISVDDGQLMTKKIIANLPSIAFNLHPSLEQDILKIVVVNRYKTSIPSVGFVHNFGFKAGAIASSVAHDSHNIIAVGTNDEDICQAVNAVIKHKGGVSLSNHKEIKVVPLPIAGLMSAEDGFKVGKDYNEIDNAAKKLGSSLTSPFMTLSFCALLVIPELKLSDLGLFDGNAFKFLDIYSE